MAKQTSGFSLEQLEQVYSAVMRELWRTRGEWDRTLVLDYVSRVFSDVCTDINSMQEVGQWSMESRLPNQ